VKRVLLATGIAALVAGTLFPPSAPAVERLSTRSSAQFEAGIVARVNALRTRHGLGSLRLSRELKTAARHHAQDMAQSGFCGHASANGAAFEGRLLRYYARRPGWRFWSAGENVLCHPRGVTPARALALWLGSPSHRATLLSSTWREVGVAAAYGTINGEEVVFVTADFGVRR
jgi:uncharacterized protein YkwD